MAGAGAPKGPRPSGMQGCGGAFNPIFLQLSHFDDMILRHEWADFHEQRRRLGVVRCALGFATTKLRATLLP